MNEPASFCYHPCNVQIDQVNVTEVMLTLGNVPPLDDAIRQKRKQNHIDLHYPPYAIKNDLPRLSDKTVPVDAVHYNGLTEYDTREYIESAPFFDSSICRQPIRIHDVHCNPRGNARSSSGPPSVHNHALKLCRNWV